MPTRGVISYETFECLRRRIEYPHEVLAVARKRVIPAQNELARQALELTADFEPRYVLWIEDDVLWPEGSVRYAVETLETHPEIDMLCGSACTAEPFRPVIGFPFSDDDENDGPLVRLRYGGFRWTLMRRSLLEQVGANPFSPVAGSGREHMTEAELSNCLINPSEITPGWDFCVRANDKGAGLYLASEVVIGHLDHRDPLNERIFFPGKPAMIANGLEQPLPVPDKPANARPNVPAAARRYDNTLRFANLAASMIGALPPPDQGNAAEAVTDLFMRTTTSMKESSEALRVSSQALRSQREMTETLPPTT
jgi:hypothetical protein